MANKARARTPTFDIQLFRLKSPPCSPTPDGKRQSYLSYLLLRNPLAVAFASTYIVPKEGLNATGH